MSKSQTTGYSWRIALGLAAAVGIFYAGGYAARAGSAEIPQSTLSYAGVLLKDDLPLTGRQELVFSFKKAGQATCTSPRLEITADSAGRFQVLIPMSNCPSSLFDGSSITVDISVGSDLAAQDVASLRLQRRSPRIDCRPWSRAGLTLAQCTPQRYSK